MSAHWYWDWDWGGGPPGGDRKSGLSARAANTGGDGPKKQAHVAGDQAPFPFPSVKPCQKVQVYFGPIEMIGRSAGGTDDTPHYPPKVNWNHFSQQEQYLDDSGHFTP